MTSAADYLLTFTVILLVSAAYYVASVWLSPQRRRRGDAVAPYACGERWSATERAEPPYAEAVLLFAAVETVPIAVLVGAAGSWYAFLPLLTAAVLAPLVAGGGKE